MSLKLRQLVCLAIAILCVAESIFAKPASSDSHRRVRRGLCYDLMHCRDDNDLFCERLCAKFGDQVAMDKIRIEENRRRRKQKHKGTGRRNSNSIAREGYYYY